MMSQYTVNTELAPEAIVERLVAQYASGSLGGGMNLLMASVLTLRPELRREYNDMLAIQGALLDEETFADVSETALDDILAKLDKVDIVPVEAAVSSAQSVDKSDDPSDTVNCDIPSPIRSFLDNEIADIGWKFAYPGVKQKILKTGDSNETVKLLKISPGRAAPRHTHKGFEATLVLRGAFRDDGELYSRGDVAFANGNVTHRPQAEGDEDCYCLAVTNGPLRISDSIKRLVRDFIH